MCLNYSGDLVRANFMGKCLIRVDVGDNNLFMNRIVQISFDASNQGLYYYCHQIAYGFCLFRIFELILIFYHLQTISESVSISHEEMKY